MQHALRAALRVALELTALAVLVALCCQWATLGLRYEAQTASPLAIFEAAPAAPIDEAPSDPAPREPRGADYVQLAGLND